MNHKLRMQIQTFVHQWQSINQRLSKYLLIAFIVSLITVACTGNTKSTVASDPSPSPDSALTIWWEKGFALEEDEALQKLVSNWKKETGKPVHLSFYTTDDLAQRAQRALQAGDPPDLMMSHSAEQSLNPRLAWQNKLVDISDVIDPIKDTYPTGVLDGVYFYNNVEKKRAYYAAPIAQTAMYIFYWRDLVKQAGFDDQNFPTDWNQYWDTWKQVQNKLRQQGQDIYSLGIPLSIGGADSDHFFEQTLEAFDADLLDAQGNLLIDDPTVQKNIQESLRWITQFYQEGYVPPDAIKWLSPDNNNNLLNRVVVMTPNATLSIPTAVQQDKDTYFKKLGTLGFPNKPSGEPMRYVTLYRQVVAFADAKNHETAKNFLTYLLKSDTLGSYLKLSSRNLPVTKPIWQDSFWTNASDPHRSIASKVLIQDPTRPFYSAYHPAYSVVIEEEVWTRAINRIVVDNVPVDVAANEAISQIKEIFKQWK